MESNPDHRHEQNGFFEEEIIFMPYEEEIRMRAEQILSDNQDALRHSVDVVGWETFDYPEIRRFLIPLLWHWADINPSWVAEACCMSVRNVCEIAESQPLMTFNCLDCGVELPVRSRQHLITLYRSLEAFCKGQTNDCLADLLCMSCIELRDKRDEEQQRIDQQRHQALLAEYRQRPYSERRKTQEWEVLKKQVFRRDSYRCRMCNRNDLPLHPHHRTYVTYAEERLEDLITLCAKCHGIFHSLSEVS